MSLRIYDRMVKEEQEGVRPVNRTRDWKEGERRKEKANKRNSW